MRHARDAIELLEIAGDERRTVVRDKARLYFRVLFLGAFENYFDIRFRFDSRKSHEEASRLRMATFSSGVKCFRSFLIRSLRYLNGRTLFSISS